MGLRIHNLYKGINHFSKGNLRLFHIFILETHDLLPTSLVHRQSTIFATKTISNAFRKTSMDEINNRARIELLPLELRSAILLEIDDMGSLRSAIRSCKSLHECFQYSTRLQLYTFLDRKLVHVAAIALASAKVDTNNETEIQQFYERYIHRRALRATCLPSIEEVKPLHQAVCHFADRFLEEAWKVLPEGGPGMSATPPRNVKTVLPQRATDRIDGPPSQNEILRVVHAFYAQEYISRFICSVDGQDVPVISQELRHQGTSIFSNQEMFLVWEIQRNLCYWIDEGKFSSHGGCLTNIQRYRANTAHDIRT